MSFRLPLLFDSNTDNNELGSSFQRIKALERSRGLIDPLQGGYGGVDKSTGRVGSTDIRQIDDIRELLPDDDNLDSLTILKASQNLVDEANTRTLTAHDRQFMNMDTSLDPLIEQAVARQAFMKGSNIMSDQPEDFINEIQQGVQSFYQEKNLYNAPPGVKNAPIDVFLEDLLLKTGDKNGDGIIDIRDLTAQGLESLFKMGEAEIKNMPKTKKVPADPVKGSRMQPRKATPAPVVPVPSPSPSPAPSPAPPKSQSPIHGEL